MPELGPVRVGNRTSSSTHEFWNVDMGVAAADEANPNGFRLLRLSNETSAATMPMRHFWERPATESAAVHYYSGSLLEEDGRASLPALQRGLDELIAKFGGRSRPLRHFLKVWLGTDGASTPLHYDTQHNVYAQLHGTKDFWVLPPYATRHVVNLYPRIHPLSHFVRGFAGGARSLIEAERSMKGCDTPINGISPCTHCFDGRALSDIDGRCMLHIRLQAGDVFYLPPFWLHRAVCVAPSCASTNAWVSSHAMGQMEALEAMPLPFEASWALPTRLAAVLAFLRALLRAVHADEVREEEAIDVAIRAAPPPPGGYPWFPPSSLTPEEMVEQLLSTRWHRAEEELLRAPPDGGSSRAQQMAATAACEPPPSDGDGGLVNLTKIDEYARRRAAPLAVEGDDRVYFDAQRSWRGPKLLLLHDQLERIAHWATDGNAAATLALLRRLRRCCKQGEDAVVEHDEM